MIKQEYTDEQYLKFQIKNKAYNELNESDKKILVLNLIDNITKQCFEAV